MGTSSNRVNILIILCLLTLPFGLLGQKPYINSISPTNVEVGQTVTISGSNLTGVTRVFFGSVEVTDAGETLNVVSNNLIQVTVPAGATQGSITVLHPANGIAQSSEQFFIRYVGSGISDYDDEYLVESTELAASSICMCDLNNDGKNDLVIIHNAGLSSPDNSDNEISIYQNNTSGTGALSDPDFELQQTINNSFNQSGFVSVACADLDNDGKQDLAFASNLGTNSRDIYIYRNESTPGGAINISYQNLSELTLPNTEAGNQRIPRTIKIGDMDGDGLNDLVVGNDTDASFHIFRNNTSSSISFVTPATEIIANNESTGLLDIADYNNDGLLDIVTLPFRVSNTGIHFFQNGSIVGNFAFEFQNTVTNGGQTTDVTSGDFNNDGLIDIVVTSRDGGRITTFTNQTSGSSIAFGNQNNLTTSGNSATGVSLADLNGDGLLDIASTAVVGNVYIFENTSSGTVSFGPEVIETTESTTQYVVTGDLNGDAKPDIAYTHNTALDQIGDLGIILNRNCVEPVISPSGLEFCLNDDFTVNATEAPGGSYAWEIVTGGGTDPADTDSEAVFTVTSGTTATIRVTLTQDGCVTQSTADFTMLGGTQPTAPTFDAGSDDAICVGDDYDIELSGGPFEEYEWTLPDGSTTTTTNGILSITNATQSNSGIYSVRAKPASGCFSEESADFFLATNQPPKFQVFNNGDDVFCESSSAQLEVPNFPSDYSYQWKLNGTNIGGATNSTFTANASGDYSVEITDLSDNCTNETDAYTLNAVSVPESLISGPSETCQNFETTFSAGSTGETGFTLEYSWFIDGSPVTPATPTELTTTFTTTGVRTVSLITSYSNDEVASCNSTQFDLSVTVSAEPTITFDQTDLTAKCQADVVTVGLQSPAEGTIDTYAWTIRNADSANDTIISTGSGSSLDIITPIGVDTVYAVVDILTTIGCTVSDSIRIRNFESNVDISSSDFTSILEFDTALLEDATSISLSAENIVSDLNWGPEELTSQFSDPTASTTLFFPQNPTSLVTLTGVDMDGCTVSTQVRVTLDNIRPKRTFSPNGDGMNDCWEILNIGDLGQANECKVYIFDSRGRNILVRETFDEENCVWDGNFDGSPVPEGVYYFVMKCNPESFSKTGSILLAK